MISHLFQAEFELEIESIITFTKILKIKKKTKTRTGLFIHYSK